MAICLATWGSDLRFWAKNGQAAIHSQHTDHLAIWGLFVCENGKIRKNRKKRQKRCQKRASFTAWYSAKSDEQNPAMYGRTKGGCARGIYRRRCSRIAPTAESKTDANRFGNIRLRFVQNQAAKATAITAKTGQKTRNEQPEVTSSSKTAKSVLEKIGCKYRL